MHITQEEVVDRQVALSIELEDADLEPYLERGYRKVVQKVNIPGFRKGKAPRGIVEQYYGKEGLLNDIWEHMASDVTNKAIDAQKLEASGLPKVELLNLSPVTIKALVPLTPEVELGDYKAIRVALKPVDVTDEQVSERMEAIRSATATWDPVDRPAKMGDLVTATILGVVDGQKWIDQPDAVIVLDRESDRPLPGFSEAVEGAAKGEPKEFKLPFPEDYPEAKLSGKEGTFTVTVSEVKEKNLPALDDEFAKGVGEGYESLEKLRETVRQELVKEAENSRDSEHRDAVLAELIKGATFVLPPLLVDHEAEHVLSDRVQTLARMNVRLEDYVKYSGTTIEKMQDEAKQTAEDRLKRAFAMRKFADAESLEVPEDAIEERLKTVKENAQQARAQQAAARRKGSQPRQHQHGDDDLDSPQTRESIKRALLMENALDRLSEISADGTGETESKLVLPSSRKPRAKKSEDATAPAHEESEQTQVAEES
ncbi:MAG: trigger factor [SAR202 cluster bacterium]|nr:trigger factor [SAR202 cluster bacterium]